MTKKVPLTIDINGRKTVIGSAEVDEDDETVVKAEVDQEYAHLIQGHIDNRFSIGESPKDQAIREEVEKHNVFKDHQLRGGEHSA